VHEQPQWNDANGDIEPVLQVVDVQIAHTGYLYEAIRRDKAIHRNLPLLIRDQKMFPERKLGTLLVLREHANMATWDRERAGGELTDKAKYHYGQVIALFEEHYQDHEHKYHQIARPFYEQALKAVNGAIEIEIAITGAKNGLNGARPSPERAWARTVPQLRSLLHARVEAMLKPLEGPPAMDVEPLHIYGGACTDYTLEVPA
jgi:hypothetical protein